MLEFLGKTLVSAEPYKGLLGHPASGQDLEAFGVIGSLDGLDRPPADFAA